MHRSHFALPCGRGPGAGGLAPLAVIAAACEPPPALRRLLSGRCTWKARSGVGMRSAAAWISLHHCARVASCRSRRYAVQMFESLQKLCRRPNYPTCFALMSAARRGDPPPATPIPARGSGTMRRTCTCTSQCRLGVRCSALLQIQAVNSSTRMQQCFRPAEVVTVRQQRRRRKGGRRQSRPVTLRLFLQHLLSNTSPCILSCAQVRPFSFMFSRRR